jgi:hypothetical protein
MNYYIKGSPARADEIKAAFEKLEYDTSRHFFNAESVLYFTLNGEIRATTCSCTPAIIKTHPDYKELELPVEPKFKVGDWLVYKYGNCFAGSFMEAQVVKVKDGVYYFSTGSTGSCKFIDETCSLWSIANANDGDVLVDVYGNIGIFQKNDDFDWTSYCSLGSNKGFQNFNVEHENDKTHPVTKEQRDLLFAKMKEAGYEWNAEKKELRKIKPHYDISNFKPFDHCRFKPTETHDWIYADFLYIQAHYKVEHLSAIEKWES